MSWVKEGSNTKLTGKASGTIAIGKAKTKTTYQRSWELPTRNSPNKFNDKLSGTVEYPLKSGFLPSFAYRISRTTLRSELYGVSRKHSANLSFDLIFPTINSVENSFSLGANYRDRDGWSYNFSDDLTWAINPNITPQLELKGQYVPSSEELSSELVTTLKYPLQKYWSLSVRTGFRVGTAPEEGLKSSTFGAVTVMAKF